MTKIRVFYNNNHSDKSSDNKPNNNHTSLLVTVIYYNIKENSSDENKIIINEIRTFKNRKYIELVKEILDKDNSAEVECVVGVSDVITATSDSLSSDDMYDKICDTVSYKSNNLDYLCKVDFNNSIFYTYMFTGMNIYSEIEVFKATLQKDCRYDLKIVISDFDLCLSELKMMKSEQMTDYALVYEKSQEQIFMFLVKENVFCRVMMTDGDNIHKLLDEFEVKYCAFINSKRDYDMIGKIRLHTKYPVYKTSGEVISNNRIYLYISDIIMSDAEDSYCSTDKDIEDFNLLKNSINYVEEKRNRPLKKFVIFAIILSVFVVASAYWIFKGSGLNIIINTVTGVSGMTTEEQVSKEHRISYDKINDSIRDTGITVNGTYLRENIMYVIINTNEDTSMLGDVRDLLENNGYEVEMSYDEDSNIVMEFALF